MPSPSGRSVTNRVFAFPGLFGTSWKLEKVDQELVYTNLSAMGCSCRPVGMPVGEFRLEKKDPELGYTGLSAMGYICKPVGMTLGELKLEKVNPELGYAGVGL